jgi:hypothetical protein
MMKPLITIGMLGVLTFVVAGAYASPQKASPASVTDTSSGTDESSSLSGKVVETMNAGGYTYVRIQKNGKKIWVAVPETQVTVGQKISFVPGQEMKDFTSKSLNRTFDSIIFSGGTIDDHAAAADKKEPAHETHAGSKAAVTKPAEKISVGKAAGPDSYTVGEVFEKRAALNEKTAVVKAKVVKVSEGIMGKNWIHLQDGTGDAAKGTHNLVATSQDVPSVGDIVIVKGTIYKDKDFGFGYKYDVIMEQASIQR